MTKVELVARTQGVGLYNELDSGGIVEAVARHGKIKDYGKLITFLMKHKHWSPLEHVHFTFLIETSRDVSAQAMRHRSLHMQELSQRYDVIQDLMPVELRLQADKNRQSSSVSIGTIEFPSSGGGFTIYSAINEKGEFVANGKQLGAMRGLARAILEAREAYKECVDAGIARECARRGLPMCAKTVIHLTGNLRDFLAYINVRAEESTQKEHREVALGIGAALEREFPKFKETFPNWEQGNFM